jgi:hypothetical protein
MSVAQRERAIMDFEDQPEVLVLLVSLKVRGKENEEIGSKTFPLT